jgi:hypothetical protein
MPKTLDAPRLATDDSGSAGGKSEKFEETSSFRIASRFAIFVSAFLLFAVQLFIGKVLLPRFGGAPAVWTTCLLTFQILLLAGYALADFVARRPSLKSQVAIMAAILGISLAVLGALSAIWETPITPGVNWRPLQAAGPSLAILLFVGAAIGLPFLILSTTSPLLQAWSNQVASERSPYRLYALSNTGSLLGLLSYPFVIEPNIRLHLQAWLWVSGYVGLAAAYAICAARVASARPALQGFAALSVSQNKSALPLGWRLPMLWVALAGCASVLLMASTNFICQEVAVIPFLWVLPLSLYLVSFILAFENQQRYRRGLFHAMFAASAAGVVIVTLPRASYSYQAQLAVCCVLLFSGCMVCHGEAARSRPANEQLTKFYLWISTGGVLGGILVTLIAPRIFPAYWEYPLGIIACAILLVLAGFRDASSWLRAGKCWPAILLLGGGVMLGFQEMRAIWAPASGLPRWLMWLGALLTAIAVTVWYLREQNRAAAKGAGILLRASLAWALLCLAIGFALSQVWLFSRVLARSRNFYGVMSVVDVQPENYLMLTHGLTAHGYQSQNPALRRTATGYYAINSGVNRLLRDWPHHPMRVGVVGMGAGTLAALGQPGDVYRFYEINPDVLKFSIGPQAHFTFIKDSPARVEAVLGDARISLERELALGEMEQFDVLVLDAFSSDAIPIHLLTREAFEVYRKHLRGPDSVIAVHITNATLDLGPVVAGTARDFGWYGVRTNPVWLTGLSRLSDWVLLSKNPAMISSDSLKEISVPFPGKKQPIHWTDEYSNLLQILR